MLKIGICSKIIIQRFNILVEVTNENIYWLQKTSSIYCTKLQIGDLICNDDDEPYLPVIFNQDLQLSDKAHFGIPKSQYFELSQCKKFILRKDQKVKFEKFIEITNKMELELAKFFIQSWNQKQLKVGNIIVKGKYHTSVVSDNLDKFLEEYQIIQK